MLHRAILALVIAVTACGRTAPSGPRPTTFGGDRPTELHAPAMLDDGKLYPLLVVLHGYGASGLIQTSYFGVSGLPDDGQALLLAPDGTRDSQGNEFWNADPVCCDLDHRNPDDVGYLGGLIDDVSRTWPVDPGAVYLLGHSNGAFMGYRMACDRADVVTAIAGLAGGAASMAESCQPSQPVSILHVHGTKDDVVPYDGGVGPGAVASITQWAAHNGCGTTRTAGASLDLDTSQPGAETATETVDGCPSGGAVELWSMDGVGHIPALGTSFAPTVMQWLGDHHRS